LMRKRKRERRGVVAREWEEPSREEADYEEARTRERRERRRKLVDEK
jgi:hypothetical protein